MFLRHFRNVGLSAEEPTLDASYEKERSRQLLERNATLRRDAQSKGNLPAEELLGSLEPLLLDIANLPERPGREDMLSIKERIQKKEIIATLQVYSAPVLARIE
jgi:hypothetical protein